MTCPACRRENTPDAQFCSGCGTKLANAHPAGTGRDLRAYTPHHLAEKILTSRSALEGERKQVTVLFADVKGSMELAEQLDPEDWHRIIERFLHLLAEGVHRFEGTVNQYTGDGIMALFGAPIAHEDHAQRACWAALHLQEALRRYADELRLGRGLDFSVRMGLNSGDVVVGKIGDDLRMDYTAIGHTLRIAQRMEQLAAADRAYLTEHTAGLVEGYFRLRDLGELAVKGATAPLRVYELEGAGTLRTRLDASRARGFTRFVGRVDEMALLEAALARAREGDGQVVGVVGEAGIGKSRLCHEFLERCRARGLETYQAYGVAHGKAIPFLPVLQLMRNIFGITEGDSPLAARQKITGVLLLLDRTLDDTLPIVFDFLGVPDPERPARAIDAGTRQQALFGLTRRVIEARRETSVTLLEDLHWFDAGSEAFLEPFVDARIGTRGLLLLNFRPGYQAPWMDRAHYRQIALRPLGAEDTTELLRALLGSDPSLASLTAAIRERTGGNPFFVEEVVRSLEETGVVTGPRGAQRLARPVAALAVPATVQAVLSARIDRLGEREKEVLQTAAVIGREFGEALLARVVGRSSDALAAALSALVAGEFVYESAFHPELEYTFAHPLTREVAYGSQLADRRARVHAAVARALEEGDASKLDERAAALAHHWEAAGEPLPAARWHRRAATWALLTDVEEARRHWEQVRALAHGLPGSKDQAELGATACSQLLFLASRLGLPEEEATPVFEQGMTWAEATDDARLRVTLLVNFGRFRALCLGDARGAVELSEQAVRVATEADDLGARLFAVSLANAWLSLAGRAREGLRMAETAVELAAGDTAAGADLVGWNPHLIALQQGGLARSMLGRSEEGWRDVEQALALAARQALADPVGSSHWAAAIIAFARGDAAACMRHALAVVEIATKAGSIYEALGHAALGCSHLVTENWKEAVAAFEHALETMRHRRAGRMMEAHALDRLAEAHLGAGDIRRARAAVDEAIALAEKRGTVGWGYRGRITLARVLLATSGAVARPAVEAALATAQAQVDQSGERVHQPFIHLARAELAAALGDAAVRQSELREAHRLFTEMGAPLRAAAVERELRV